MNEIVLGRGRVAEALSHLGQDIVVNDLGETSDCPGRSEIMAVASDPVGSLGAVRRHVATCSRCAYLLASYQGANAIGALPHQCEVALGSLPAPDISDTNAFPYRLWGYVNLERLTFVICEEREHWLYNPLHMRVSFVVDPLLDILSVDIVDRPSDLEAFGLRTSTETKWFLGEADGPQAAFQKQSRSAGRLVAAEALEILREGKGKLVFRTRDRSGVCGILEQAAAIKRNGDYGFPSGWRSNAYIDLSTVCRRDRWLQGMAEAIEYEFRSIPFDTVVTHGWAMAQIARKIQRNVNRDGRRPKIGEVMFTGYRVPMPMEDFSPDSKVLLLLDVCTTSGLMDRMRHYVEKAGSQVVATGAIVAAHSDQVTHPKSLRALCHIQMSLAKGTTPRMGTQAKMGRMEFNPLSGCMVQTDAAPVSPSQFLFDNPDALKFWQMVDTAGAYQHHRIERGTVHYRAFVHTTRLLNHTRTGPEIVSQFADKLLHSVCPSAIVVPRRSRGLRLGRELQRELERRVPGLELPMLVARREDGQWALSRAARRRVRMKDVLIVDSAVGHGKTIEVLADIVREAGARQVGAAVLLSRVSGDCEQALQSRWSLGFHRLFHFPVQPVVIRGSDPMLCPVCRDEASHQQARGQRLSPLSQLPGRRSWNDVREKQQALPCMDEVEEVHPFLTTCSSRIAGGVVLHALYHSMNESMSPLKLPEITSGKIPAKNRAAMLNALPQDILELSHEILIANLRDCVTRLPVPTVLAAAAATVIRERRPESVEDFRALIGPDVLMASSRCGQFWSRLHEELFASVQRAPESVVSWTQLLDDFIHENPDEGIRRQLEQIRCSLQEAA